MTPARSTWLPFLAAVPAVLLVVQVHFICGVVYSLDDPYIHLALARQILHGHYGINAGEFAAPSSSILWPFLLAPFTFTRVSEYLPLVIDLAALVAAVWWLQRWFEAYLSPWWALVATAAVAFALNLYGLVLTGMENSLQVTLTVIVAVSFVQNRLRWPFWLSIVLLPFIRYEGLAISLPALFYLLFAGEHRMKALVSSVLIAGGVGGFSLFLYSHGVGLLPSSVLAKNGLRMMNELRGLDALRDQLVSHLFFVILAVFAAILAVREGRPGAALLLVVVPTALHMLFGKYAWFGRYHIYFAAWISILFVASYARSGLGRLMPLNLLLATGFVYSSIDTMIVTLTTPLGSRNIGDQQKQMATIARDYLDEAVAVNDLGFVSYYARRYVLDLAGLASYEALRANAESAPEIWVAKLMDQHKVEHAMVFDQWFPRWPVNWIRVATLTLPLPWITVGDDHVAFYSTSPEAAARLRQALERYRKSSRQAAMMLTLESQ
jgi:hypothetical protein